MKNLFEKRYVEITELDLILLRVNQVVGAVGTIALLVTFGILGLIGIWSLLTGPAKP